MSQPKVLVTGANGFVGKRLCMQMKDDVDLIATVRSNTAFERDAIHTVNVEINANTDWKTLLNGVDVIVHLAGRAHVMHETAKDVYQAYAAINVDGTKRLIESAIQAGVKRFIYISTSKVNGEYSDKPFLETDATAPEGPYAVTKDKAETLLQTLSKDANLDYVIIRPPLIYGEGVKANFQTLMKLSQSRLPLPLGAINNKRSMLYLENLTDFITICMTHPAAANQIFFVADGEDVSTTGLLKLMAAAANKQLTLIPVPMSWFKFGLTLLNKRDVYTKLCSDLQVDTSKARALLGWQPPFTVEAGIQKTVASFKQLS